MARLALLEALCSNDAVKAGRILALDYGRRRVGLALCDELRVTVRPLPALLNKSRRELIGRIRQLVDQHEVTSLVVGLPLNMDGTAGDAAGKTGKFMEALSSQLNLPLTAVDERLTTVEAAELWRTMPLRQQKKYSSVDSLAAALILQRFLEER